ncbi:MAG: CPBP family intramembrane metalloprotease [Candidatus Micrarchaeota archaeon]|nr:CPBP family intramembrane metalloprotease [Candidatus Micrarchaeota archaeon]MDE1859728.1 CPBP family intramembrane metalloprotease [Candidatus Micrarchaeota archaeon]
MPRRPKKQTLGRLIANGVVAFVLISLIYIVVTGFLSGIVLVAQNSGYINANASTYILYAVSLLCLSLAIFLYFIIFRSIRAGQLPAVFGFSLPKLTTRNISIGLVIFFIILAIEFFIGLLSVATNTTINPNVAKLFHGAPIWFFLFASVIEPINEEIVFRGYLVPRIGILPSAIIFGLAHYTYNSTFGVEVIVAFIFGTIAGYVFKKTGSLYPSIIAHILVNSLAAISILAFPSMI